MLNFCEQCGLYQNVVQTTDFFWSIVAVTHHWVAAFLLQNIYSIDWRSLGWISK